MKLAAVGLVVALVASAPLRELVGSLLITTGTYLLGPGPELTEAQLQYVVDSIRGFYKA